MKKIDSNSIGFNNYVLLGNDINELKSIAIKTANKTREHTPACFNAEKSYIEFELKYVPPFEKNFDELFKLQGIAAETPRYKDEYRGYIVLDVSKYLAHEKEDWFDITLKFLHDQGDYWKCIFLVDMTNKRSGEEMVSKILSLLYCRVEDECKDEKLIMQNIIDRECRDNKITLSKSTVAFLAGFFVNKKHSREIITVFIKELLDKVGNQKNIDMKTIRKHIAVRESVIKYMMSVEDYTEFVEKIAMYAKKGIEYAEKV